MGKGKNWRKILVTTVVVILLLFLAAAVGALLWWNHLLSLMGDAGETTGTMPAAPVSTPTAAPLPSTQPEETWPEIKSEEAVTNIMLIGQNFREGENHQLADTMILCSLNRDTGTLSLVSFLRDLYVPIPDYHGRRVGRNRMNVCYHWGSTWSGTPEGGMELLAACVEENFGVSVDHSIAVNFDDFTQLIDALGGVEIELTETEARYLGYVGEFQPGKQILNGLETLAYARIRKIDSDIQRTGRQRAVLTSLVEKCKTLGLMELYGLAQTVLPMITTDMSVQEITAYLWEILPMLKDLQIRSVTCPLDNGTLPGSRWDSTVDIGGTESAVIECNLRRNREYLTRFLEEGGSGE